VPDSRNDALGAALGRIPSGLFVLALRDARGAPAGMLLSWVQQASFEPPLVTFALGRNRPLRELLDREGRFSISILAKEDRGLAGVFARTAEPEGKGPFDQIAVASTRSGLPYLAGALAYVEGRVRQRVPSGDHVLYFGEIEAGAALRDAEPAVHVRRSGFQY